jgi:arylsulfatase A-like enzyme
MPIDDNPNSPTFAVPGLALPAGLSVERISHRRSLMEDAQRIDTAAPGWDKFQHQAFDTLLSAEARGAFAIDREDPRLRDRYGRHIHGQCLLLARRLVEAGVRLVTVNWHDDGRNFWDTHGDNFNRLKNDLMPPADQGFAALLDDLAARRLLDTTLVVWVGEFGRAPRITAANAGREHWPRCYSAALAGAGIRGGIVRGASDRWAAYPASQPTSPEDLGATILHALGVDPATVIHDSLNRPMRINDGNPLVDLFA